MGQKAIRPTFAAYRRRLRGLSNARDASVALGYFKTGPGEYGEGDRFLGIRAAPLRQVAREFRRLSLADLERALESAWHEERLAALLIMAQRYPRADPGEQRALYQLYLARTDRINNWDLVDCSAEHVVGAHLASRSRRQLDRLIRSRSVWERRIALIATFHFIKHGEFLETFRLVERVLADKHDLIHKAAGWMLRETGKRGGLADLERFLRKHQATMPRTMLRYAIERFPESRRKRYLRGTA